MKGKETAVAPISQGGGWRVGHHCGLDDVLSLSTRELGGVLVLLHLGHRVAVSVVENPEAWPRQLPRSQGPLCSFQLNPQ